MGTIFPALLLLPFTLLTAFFVVEVLAGLPRLRRPASGHGKLPSAVIIVPAHNEEAIVEATLQKLFASANSIARIIVVADNCSDRTAALARRSGAEVLERHDVAHRGKGFALAYARESLAGDPPQVVVILDADCTIDRASLISLIAAAETRQLPTQAVYLFRPSPHSPLMVQISGFAFMLKNLVRQRGLMRLARRVHLTGSGMALPWRLFAQADLATGNIVEDLQLGLDLAASGSPPQLAEEARVWSLPADAAETLVQRGRWEGGFLVTMRNTAPAVLAGGFRRMDLRTVIASIDLCVPPLALLIALDLGALFLAVSVTWLLGASWWPVLVQCVMMVLLAATVLLAWAKEGRAFLDGRELLKLPMYLLWKLPLYAGLSRSGAPKHWQRTKR